LSGIGDGGDGQVIVTTPDREAVAREDGQKRSRIGAGTGESRWIPLEQHQGAVVDVLLKEAVAPAQIIASLPSASILMHEKMSSRSAKTVSRVVIGTVQSTGRSCHSSSRWSGSDESVDPHWFLTKVWIVADPVRSPSAL